MDEANPPIPRRIWALGVAYGFASAASKTATYIEDTLHAYQEDLDDLDLVHLRDLLLDLEVELGMVRSEIEDVLEEADTDG